MQIISFIVSRTTILQDKFCKLCNLHCMSVRGFTVRIIRGSGMQTLPCWVLYAGLRCVSYVFRSGRLDGVTMKVNG
jgi:hypothetical protein